MPFGEDFDKIYDLFYVDTLSKAGFEVSRADDIRSSQSIMKDIVRGIAESDLIVADLTGSNPNVYYELGLAHSLRKPVIILTQEMKDLPFDLRAYRVISYGTHFTDFERARKDLKDLAAGYIEGTTEFGSPISDFLRLPTESMSQHPIEDREVGEPGFLDYLAELEENFEQMTESLTKIGAKTEELSQSTSTCIIGINALKDARGKTTARRMRSFVLRLAHDLDGYARFLSEENGKYGTASERAGASLEEVLRAQAPQSPEEQNQLENLLSTLGNLEDSTTQAFSETSKMADILRELPTIERTFNRARKRVVKQLQVLTGNIQQAILTISRVKEIGYKKLNRASERDGE